MEKNKRRNKGPGIFWQEKKDMVLFQPKKEWTGRVGNADLSSQVILHLKKGEFQTCVETKSAEAVKGGEEYK